MAEVISDGKRSIVFNSSCADLIRIMAARNLEPPFKIKPDDIMCSDDWETIDITTSEGTVRIKLTDASTMLGTYTYWLLGSADRRCGELAEALQYARDLTV